MGPKAVSHRVPQNAHFNFGNTIQLTRKENRSECGHQYD